MQPALVLCLAWALFLSTSEVHGRYLNPPHIELSSSGKPLIKRPPGRTYKTILSGDPGALRGLLSAIVMIEVEQSIKAFLLANPHLLPAGIRFSSVDDFDINLADYFDCMTGISAGAWSTLYLASRGGQGASRAVLDDPAIIAKYGLIPTGGAEGLRVFYKEYGSTIYPLQSLNLSAGIPFDITNPSAPGVSAPLLTLDGLEQALEAFCGNATLSDLDTSIVIPALDLLTASAILFVQNRFRKIPVSSSVVLAPITRPRSSSTHAYPNFFPDLVFDESKDYYIKDVGQAAGAPPRLHPAKSIVPVGTDTEQFLAIDGGVPIEKASFPASFFVAAETGAYDFERIAILTIGTGRLEQNFTRFENAGAAAWGEGTVLPLLQLDSGLASQASLFDYLFYANPRTKPYQHLRVQYEAPLGSADAMVVASLIDATSLDDIEELGSRVAAEYRPSIDIFVRDFIFG